MKKVILCLGFCGLLSSCVTPPKPVDPNSTFDTEMGFKIQPPPNGPWYPIRTPDGTGYVLGREPSKQDKEDGSTIIAEVRYGFINLAGLKLKNSKDIFKFFEDSMRDKRETDRFEKTLSDFKPTKHKNAECTVYEQIGQNDKMTKSRKGEKMSMSARGLLCLHPKDQGRYIRMTISQRMPVSKPFQDLKADETQFYNTLVFSEPTGTPPQ